MAPQIFFLETRLISWSFLYVHELRIILYNFLTGLRVAGV